MAEKIIMPKLGMAMEKGIIISWLKEVGDKVNFGDPLLEIETDKTSMQVEADSEGHLLLKLYDSGDEVAVLTTIGYLGKPGENILTDESKKEEKQDKIIVEQWQFPEETEEKVIDVTDKVLATPAAKRLAKQQGITLEDLAVEGIIHAEDVIATSEKKIDPLDQKSEMVEFNNVRKTIASRMTKSHQEIPPVTLNTEADVSKLLELRTKLNEEKEVKVSLNDLVIRACVLSLEECKELNSSYSEEGLVIHQEINIGIAVALDDGLIVPVIRKADQLSLEELTKETRRLADKARSKELSLDDYSGGTFTVTNLGMFGITSFTPIINLPESAILGVCAITEQLKLINKRNIENRQFMGLSLTFDHRCIDGALGAKFLKHLVSVLENPDRLFE